MKFVMICLKWPSSIFIQVPDANKVMDKFCSLNVSKVNKKSSLRKEKMIIEVFQMTGSSSHLSFNILFLVIIFNYFKGSFSRTCYLTIIRQLIFDHFWWLKHVINMSTLITSPVQLLSHVWLFATPLDYSTPGLPIHQPTPSLPKLMSIELVMLSNHLILCHPLLLLPSIVPSIGVFSNESALHSR